MNYKIIITPHVLTRYPHCSPMVGAPASYSGLLFGDWLSLLKVSLFLLVLSGKYWDTILKHATISYSTLFPI
jgi:hypothetical protein